MKDSFIYKAHCENGVPSSKRLYGGIGYIIVQVCIVIATTISLIKTGRIDNTIASLIDFNLVTSASLLGLSTITRIFNKNQTTVGIKDQKEKQITDNDLELQNEREQNTEDINNFYHRRRR